VIFIDSNGEGAGVRLRKAQAALSTYVLNLQVAITGARLVRFSYDNGLEHWFAPHALYRAQDGSERVRGSVIAAEDSRSHAEPITVRAADDDFDLSRGSNFDLQEAARTFRPAEGFATTDIKDAAIIHCAVANLSDDLP
jgi:hypothetical protein